MISDHRLARLAAAHMLGLKITSIPGWDPLADDRAAAQLRDAMLVHGWDISVSSYKGQYSVCFSHEHNGGYYSNNSFPRATTIAALLALSVISDKDLAP